jgi:DNA-binding IscR family transcriptional regulator
MAINVDDYILGNKLLHRKLCVATEVLMEFVMVAPRSLNVERLAGYTGQPARELAQICRTLGRAGLLRHDSVQANAWTLSCKPSMVTLEDVFRCVTSEQRPCSKRIADGPDAGAAHGDIRMLLIQATMEINQSVLTHLRQFSLDRLKFGGVGGTQSPVRRRKSARSCQHFGIGEHAVPGFLPVLEEE